MAVSYKSDFTPRYNTLHLIIIIYQIDTTQNIPKIYEK